MTVVRAAAAKRPPRDVACTAFGTAALHLTKHFPATTEQIVSLQLGLLLTDGAFADAEIAQGLHARHGSPHAKTSVS